MESTNGEEGTLREVAGDVQQAPGDLLGNASPQVSGTAKEFDDKAQQLYADFAEVLRESTVERPLAALAIAAGVGFILGALHVANRSRPDNVRGDRKGGEQG
ncbi:CsbD family protein [Paraburkholderia sediminicola]|nr:CsbD family protein [Paraburkholderia sediminicola]